MYKILIVEDDPGFGYILKEYLELNELDITLVIDGEQALKEVRKKEFDICLLDIMLPKMDGYTVAREIRKQYSDLPFIFITAKSLKVDKLKGFKLGCDDFIEKPIDEELLVARIYAIMQRSKRGKESMNAQRVYILGNITFDTSIQCLVDGDNKYFLTDIEFQLLMMLCNHQNKLLSRKTALQKIWGNNDEFSRKSMDVFIFKLRKYLAGEKSVRIKNIHSRGFILEVN